MSKEDEPYIPPAAESDEKHDTVVKVPSNVAGALAGASGKDETRLEDSRPPAVQSPTTEYPEGGYGWVVVACVALLNAHTWGLNSAYAVFLAYYLRSGYFDGASPMAFAFVGGLSISIALLISPIATACIGKFGTRPVLAFGVVFQTIAFTGASFTSQLWQLLLAQGVCFGLGMGFMFVGSVGVIPQWFLKRRSFASSIGAAGSGFGGLTWALATNAMISSIGLPWAFRVIAIVSFVVNATCTMLIRDRNKLVGAVHVAFHKDLFKMVQFYLLVGWVFFSMFAYIIAVFSLPDYGQTVGLTATQGSLLSAMFNLSQGLGRPMIGWASDPLGRLNVAALGTLIASLAALFIWIFAGKVFAGVLVYSLLGCFAGIIWATIPPVAAEVVGIQLLPSALSLTWLFLVLPATFAEVIGLALKTPSLGKDSYLYVQLFTGLSFFAAFVCAWLLRAWKMYDNENKEIYKTNREADSSTNDVPDHPAPTPAGDKRTFTGYLLRGKWIFAIDRV